MFRKSITTITIAAAAFVALGSSTPASAAGIDCYMAPAHCKKAQVEPVEVDPGEDVIMIVVDPKIPGPTVNVPKLKDDFASGTVIVPLGPGDTNDNSRVPVLEPPNSNDHAHVVPSGHNTPDPGDGTSTPTEPPADPQDNDRDNGHTANVGPDTSTNTSTATLNTGEPGANTSANTPTTTLNTEEPGAEAISLADQSAETNSNTTFNPMMAALFGVLASFAIMSLAGAAFAAGRRRN